jgi:hypothetical protein
MKLQQRLHRRGKNQESTTIEDHATAQTSRIGRTEAISYDKKNQSTADSLITRHGNMLPDRKLQGSLHHKTSEQNPTTITSSAQPEPRRHPIQANPSCTPVAPACLVRNLRGGQRRARDPDGTRSCSVKARCSGTHAGEATALHHGQLAVHIGETDYSGAPVGGTRRMVPQLGERGGRCPRWGNTAWVG